MPNFHVGDATLHYREAGSGNDVVLLLHAFPLHSRMWEPQLAALAARFRVLAFDDRGLGRSGGAAGPTTMARIAQDALALLRQLGIRKVAVAGLSMGGYAALELYRQAPGIFRALALCATKATPDTQAQKDAREQYARNALAKGLGWVADDFGPKLLRPDPDPALLARVKGLIQGGTPEGVAAAARGLALRQDSVPTLPLITCPTLVIAGEEDQVIPFGEAQRMATHVPGARLLRIPATGHLVNLENPTAFSAALSGFFAALPPEA
ncbi:alpha/beta fold hydrolase [Anaeromyxobacter diazotrophicus]|uniref:Alpha/beta hydrolase n=1 Tax=Anaeromyxobacter diazotrophicus TaxID=2590199 RepID=A0A7I9VL19_9BACT|nr:alpha/beta fold hydrolase [Anaeromyxobacter diazotrophicus]GEJ56687.1 alpha/beta hydrolase [Anaeromyxobacter diazotrophicus]